MSEVSGLIHISKAPTLKIGVVSDTHVPDRVSALHPDLVSALKAETVDAIFHLGDISIPSVVKTLEEIAPVYAIRGNRDFLYRGDLSPMLQMDINGVRTTLLHGQGGVKDYIVDKWFYLRDGYQFERYEKVLLRLAPEEAGVVVFGHTHQPEVRWIQNRLFFNPGAVMNPGYGKLQPTFGILWYHTDGCVDGEIISLMGARMKNRRWERDGENMILRQIVKGKVLDQSSGA